MASDSTAPAVAKGFVIDVWVKTKSKSRISTKSYVEKPSLINSCNYYITSEICVFC